MKQQGMKWLLAIVLLASCVARADAVDWTKYKMSVQVTFIGYAGSTTLENFPVLVRVSAANGFYYSQFKDASGGDLRFSDAEGNLLASEIDTWNPSGESLVWVKVPSLNASTVITAHYGCTSPDAVTASDVWANGYKAVWHMNDTGVTMANAVAGNADLDLYYDTVKKSTNVASIVTAQAGIVGNSVLFGQDDKKGSFATRDASVALTNATAFTVEMWAHQNDNVTGGASHECYLLSEQITIWSGTPVGFTIKEIPTSWGTGNTGKIRVGGKFDGASSEQYWLSESKPVSNEWHHVAFAYDSSVSDPGGFSIIDGNVEKTSSASVGLVQTDGTNHCLHVGNLAANTNIGWPGKIDEVRISSVKRSEDWLKATHDCAKEAGFAEYESPNDWTKYSHKFTVSFTGYTGETLTDFPVLVKISESSISGFDYDDCLKLNGGDLRFADAEGNLLASEVDTWDTTGTSLVWVKVPSLNASTKITAYYGWEFAPPSDPTRVWANGYLGVWHLNDNTTDGNGYYTMSDATGGGSVFKEDADSHGKNTVGVDGIVGDSVQFGTDSLNPTNGGMVCTSAKVRRAGASGLTVECWSWQDDHDPTSAKRWAYLLHEFNPSTWVQVIQLAEMTYPKGAICFEVKPTSGNNVTVNTGTSKPSRAEWNYHAATYDASAESKILLNGECLGSTNATGNVYSYNNANLYLGNRATTHPHVWPGKIDEVRISSVARSEDWLKATYDTVKNNATFTTYGAARENTKCFMVIIR